MKKKNILFLMAIIASFTVASCDNKSKNDNNNTNNNSTNTNTEAVKDRGKEEAGTPVSLPDALINAETDDPVDPTVLDIEGDYNESNAGIGKAVTVEDSKILIAEAKTGYDFIGWFKGEDLISTSTSLKVSDSETGIVASFKVKEEFRYLDFYNKGDECILTGIKEGAPRELEIPEGITTIKSCAFEDTKVIYVTLPESLNKLEDDSFSNSMIFKITFNNIPELLGDSLAYNSNLNEVFIPDGSIIESELENHLSCYPYIKTNGQDSNLLLQGDFMFLYDSDYGWELLRYVGDKENIVLPAANNTIESYKIYYSAFSGSDINSVEFSSAVTAIDSYAFECCENLKEVTIPDSVTYIGNNAFNSCYKLEKVVIGNGVTTIGENAFRNCTNLTEVTLGENVNDIQSEAFFVCEKLLTIYNNSELQLIEESSDYGYVAYYAYEIITNGGNSTVLSCDDFKYIETEDNEIVLIAYNGSEENVVIPIFDNKDIILGYKLFYGNKYIKNVILNDHVTEMESYVFAHSTIETFDSMNLEYISYNAFCKCYDLHSVNLKNVKYIDEETFYDCRNLREVSMPMVEEIDGYAFQNCYTLYEIELPASLTYIGHEAFYKCYNLVEVTNISGLSITKGSSDNGYAAYYALSVITHKEDTILTKNNGIVTYDDEGVLVAVTNYDIEILDIPSNVSTINQYVLSGLNKLEELQTPLLNNYIGYYFGADDYYDTYDYDMGKNYVPETLKKVVLKEGVTDICYGCFYNLGTIEELVIPSSVTNFSYNAFYACNINTVYYDGTVEDWCNLDFNDDYRAPMTSNNGNVKVLFKVDGKYQSLKVIEIPDEITFIGYYQFYGFDMEEVILPDSVDEIGSYAFANCKNLKTINFTSNLQDIESYAFYNSGIEIAGLDDVSYIGQNAFESCTKLKRVKLSDNIAYIGDYVFKDCTSLLSVHLPSELEGIGESTFENCRSLYDINIPDSLQYFGEAAFKCCENLETVDLHNTHVANIPEAVFMNCKNLTTINFSDDLESIGSTTFEGCDKLNYTVYRNGCYFGTADNPYRWLIKARAKTIVDCTVHEDCEKIFTNAFSKCTNLRKIIIPEGCNDFANILKGLNNIQYIECPYITTASFGNYLFAKDNSYLQLYVDIDTVKINGGSITSSAFKGCNAIRNVIIGENVSSIDSNAFQNSKSLESATFETSASLPKYCFSGCTALSDVTLPSNLTSIPEYAFSSCSSLESIVLPKSVTSISSRAFASSGLKSIDLTYVTDAYDGAFASSKLESVTIPSTLGLESGKVENSSTRKYGIFEGCSKLETVTYSSNYLSDATFKDCSNLATVTLSNSVTGIGDHAFLNCTSLASINLNQVTRILQSAFENSGLTSLSYSGAVDIKTKAFYNCKELKTVSLTNANTRLKYSESAWQSGGWTTIYVDSDSVFEGCSKLETVTLPSTMTQINTDTFKDCTALESIDISNVETVSSCAFQNCSSLNNLDFSNVTVIGANAFENCASLAAINGFGEEIVIGQSAFKGSTSLATVDFTNVKSIGTNSFENTGLVSITIPENMNLNTSAFANCKDLTTFVSYHTVVSPTLLSGCSSLNSVTLSGNETYIPKGIFKNCTSLTSFTIGNNIEEIREEAFYNTGLTSLTIPSNVRTIGNSAFANCKFDDIVVPATVLSLGDFVFAYNDDLINAKINCPFSASSLFRQCRNLESVVLSEGIDTIPSYTFYMCSSLNSVKFPSSLTTISDSAFNTCISLTTIIIPKSVTSIYTSSNSSAFYGCENLKEVYNYSDLEIVAGETSNGYVAYYATEVKGTIDNYDPINVNGFIFAVIENQAYLMGYEGNDKVLVLPESFEYNGNTITEYEIYTNAFYNGNIVSLTIPNSVKGINDYAFSGCYSLMEIYNLSDLNIVIGSDDNGCVALNARAIHESLDDPSAIVNINDYVYLIQEDYGIKYATVLGYSGNSNVIVIMNSITYNDESIPVLSIFDTAFMNSNIQGVSIQEGIMSIGRDAFKGCTSLTSVYLPDSLAEPEFNPFVGCTNIVNASLPMFMVKYIYDYSANIESNLEMVRIISGESLPDNAFRNCYKLRTVLLPVELTTIGKYAFSYCEALESITLPEDLILVDQYAFQYCTSLKALVLPNKAITFNAYSLQHCAKLGYVIVNNPNTVFKTYSFAYIYEDFRVFCYGNESTFGSLNTNSIPKFYYDEEEPTGKSNKWHYADGVAVEYNREQTLAKLKQVTDVMEEYIQIAIANPNYDYLCTDYQYQTSKIVYLSGQNGGTYYIGTTALKGILEADKTSTTTHADVYNILKNNYLYLEVQYYNDTYHYTRTDSTIYNGYRVLPNSSTNYDRYRLEIYPY